MECMGWGLKEFKEESAAGMVRDLRLDNEWDEGSDHVTSYVKLADLGGFC